MSEFVQHLMVRGRVQGVGYRAFVVHRALEQGLRGWVRNRRDGSVEACIAGPDAALAAFVETCRRGPPASRVEAVEVQPGGPDDLALQRPGELFSVLPTL